MNYTITPNAAYNSLEISFDGKPADAVRDALKSLKFRWHAAKKVWYGYADEATTRAAIEGKPTESKSAEKKATKINLDGLENNKKTTCGAEFAAVLRADLKARGVKGVTIRSGRGGWTDSITATITLTAEDFRSAEEAAARDGWRTFFNMQNYGVTVDGVYYHANGENAINSGSSYTDNCVAVYLGDALQFVANPEGYNYARYCYIPTQETREYSPADSAARTAAEESAQLEPFYFPAPVAEQAAALSIGETVTIYQTDGWIMVNTNKSGTLTAVEPGKYAQYTGMYLTIQRGRKSEKVFCRDGKETLIFYGDPLTLPDWAKFSEIIPGENATLRHYRDTAAELRQIIKYYSKCGRAPALDTVQR